MAVVNTLTLRREIALSERIAKEDIIEVNDLGQSVVVVPKGQPIPESVKAPEEKKTETKRTSKRK